MDTTAPTPPPLRGYRGPAACGLACITYRQLDYWARTGLVVPTVRPAHGSGSQRLYARTDVVLLALVKTLLDVGLSLTVVRALLPQVRLLDQPAPPALTLRDVDGVVSVTVDVATLAARIPEPPDEPGTQGASEPAAPALTLVP